MNCSRNQEGGVAGDVAGPESTQTRSSSTMRPPRGKGEGVAGGVVEDVGGAVEGEGDGTTCCSCNRKQLPGPASWSHIALRRSSRRQLSGVKWGSSWKCQVRVQNYLQNSDISWSIVGQNMARAYKELERGHATPIVLV